MITLQKISNNKIVIKNNDLIINTIFEEGKIWLTKRELANIYGVKKSKIKEALKELIKYNSTNKSDLIKKVYNTNINKNEKFISLDLIILLGYKLKYFNETKLIINSNKLIKEYSNNRKYKISGFYNNIINLFQPKLNTFNN